MKTINDHEATLKLLTQTLDERSHELDSLKKKKNRDAPINGVPDTLKPLNQSPSKYELLSAREEITGLKCLYFPQT